MEGDGSALMTLVIDASYTIALALQEGDIPGAHEVGEQIADQGAVVPSLWRFEVANVLLMAVRRKRIPTSRATAILADLDALPITIDGAATIRAWTVTFALAERHGLTLYDAAYLELAVRLDGALASLDGDLITAARQERLTVIGG